VNPEPAKLANLGLGALLFCATVFAYLPALSGELIWNDADYVTAPALRSLAGLVRIWTRPGATQQYYPLLHSAFWVQHRLWGDAPLGYHVITLLLHCGAALLLWLALGRLFSGASHARYARAAWLAALLFALHPVHVESVAWITEQKNTLSLVFYLGSAVAYLRFDGTRGKADYAAALALFLCALLSKTVTATLPAALLVVLWWKRGRLDARRDVAPLVPWLAIGAALGLFSGWVEKTYVGAQGADFEVAPVDRILVAGRAICFYAGKLAWPSGLNFVYPRWTVDASAGGQWLFPLGVLAVGAILWAIRRRARGPLAAYLIFIGSLFPALGFVSLYGARYSWVWDHWQYLPDISLLALVSAGLVAASNALPREARWLGSGVVCVLAMLLGALTWSHCAMFHDNETLYTTTLAKNPNSWMAHNNLGLTWSKLPDRQDDAEAQYEAALRLKPEIAETHTNLGNVLAKMPGRLPEAIMQYQEALRLKPDYSDAHFYLANALVSIGQTSEAVSHYEEALKLEPAMVEANNNLGMILCRSGRMQEGLAHIETAIKIEPTFAPAHFARAIALLQSGRRDEAVAELRTVLQLEPGNPQATRMLDMVGSR